MKSRADLNRTPLIAIAALGGAAVCLITSAIPVSVVSGLASFQNAASSVALDRVFSGHVVPALRMVAVILLLLGVAGLYWRRTVLAAISRMNAGLERIDHALLKEARSLSGLTLHAWASLAVFCAVLVLLQYGPSLRHGYFAYDDFEMLAVQQAHPLAQSIFLLHGDHTVPLLRAETALLVALFGTDALASNTLLLTLFASTIFVGSLLLREMGTGAVGIIVFVALGTSWMLWAEMLAGYYMISVYLQQLALSLLGAWAYLRWRKTKRRVFPFLLAFAAIISPFLDISGLWVPCAVVVFAFCAAMGEKISVRAWLRRDLWLLCVVASSLAGALLFNSYVFIVRSPGSFLTMSGSDGGFWSALAQLFYFFSGGLLATLLFPLGYWKLPPALLLPFLVTVTLGLLAAGASLWPKLSKPVRWYFAAIVLIVLGNGLIVVMGRPASGFAYPWQAKYAGAAYLWFCIVLAVSAYTLWQRASERRKGPTAEILGLTLVLLVSVQVLSNFLVSLFTNAPYGYPAYLKAAQERRRAVAFMSSAFAPLVSHPDARLPLLSGTAIGNRFPELVHYDLNCYWPFIVPAGRTVTFYGNAALSAGESGRVICANARMAQGFGVPTAASLRSAVGPPFIRELSRSVALQELYLSPLPLAPASPCQVLSNDTRPDERQVDVGEADPQNISIRNGRWDPEEAGKVSLRMQYSGPRPEALAYFSFDGSFSAAGAGGWIAVPAGPPICLTIDLLQLSSYALSEEVGDLNMQLATPGHYVIESATLTD